MLRLGNQILKRRRISEPHGKQKTWIHETDDSALQEIIMDLNQRWNLTRIVERFQVFAQVLMIKLQQNVDFDVFDVVGWRCEQQVGEIDAGRSEVAQTEIQLKIILWTWDVVKESFINDVVHFI